MPAQLPMVALNDTYDTVDFGQFIRSLRRRAKTVLAFTALAGAAALLHVLFATPQFTARGALYLGETQQSDPNAGNSDGTVNLFAYSTQSDVETQIELLTTGTLIKRAILETGLNTVISPAGDPPLTYWRWRLFKGGNTASFLPTAQSLQVVNATLAGHYRLVTGSNNSYKLYKRGGLFGSSKLVLSGILGRTAQTSAGSFLVRFAQQSEDSADREASNASSASSVKVKPGLAYNLDVTSPDALAQNLARGVLTVNAGGSPTQPTNLATLQIRWPNPYQAKLFINQMMSDYIATQLQWKTEAASITENFVAGQLANVSRQIASANQKLSVYQGSTGIVDPQETAQATVTQMANLQSQRATILLRMQALQQMHKMLSEGRGTVNPYLISQASDPLLSNLGTSLSESEVKLSQLEAEYTQNAQDVKIQEAQVRQLRRSISSLIENDLLTAKQEVADIDQLITKYHDDMRNQPAEALKVEGLKQTSDQLSKLYDLLTQKAEQAQISKAATIIDTRIVTMAELPLTATSPRLLITLVGGTLAGFILGIALVLVQRGVSGRFESEEQIRRAIPLPVYGAVPWQGPVPLTGGSSANLPAPIVFNPFTEAFQLIKRNIYRHSVGKTGVSVLVISANPQDGKTTIATNLAKSLASDGKRVLLINCDIYVADRPGGPTFGGYPGLLDWVRTGKRQKLQFWKDGKFHVLPAGSTRHKCKARLNESALAQIISTLAAEFDYLILDSPPLPIIADGLLLGSFADLILSVINVLHTARRAFELHSELIDTLNKPHGLIINGADVESYGDTHTYFYDTLKRRPNFVNWLRMN